MLYVTESGNYLKIIKMRNLNKRIFYFNQWYNRITKEITGKLVSCIFVKCRDENFVESCRNSNRFEIRFNRTSTGARSALIFFFKRIFPKIHLKTGMSIAATKNIMVC